MGEFIKLKPEFIKPSQNFLKKETLNFILDCYKKRKLDSLPPTPIVRKDPHNNGLYIAIDGHNLLAANELYHTECEVYVADSANDYLPNPKNLPSISQRNKDLSDKFDTCVTEANRIHCSFTTRIKDYLI